jgi:hypothetical protein
MHIMAVASCPCATRRPPRYGRAVVLGILLVILDTFWSLKKALTLVPDSIISITVEDTTNLSRASSVMGAGQQEHDSPQPQQQNTTVSATILDDSTSSSVRLHDDSDSDSDSSIKIDIISIGSIHRRDYQTAQRATFGAHHVVRHFYSFDEDTDSAEPACHKNLTMQHVESISAFCQGFGPHTSIWRMRKKFANFKWLQKKANALGWMCAQKRLPGGLATVLLKSYDSLHHHQQPPKQVASNNETAATTIPDYLIVMDDDTYLNMPLVLETLMREYPPSQGAGTAGNDVVTPTGGPVAHVIAGCLVQERIHEVNFTFPFGGWSTIFSSQAIRNFLQPIHCSSNSNSSSSSSNNNSDDDDDDVNSHKEFVTAACTRLSENLIGERNVFANGMSVAHLMDAYISRYQYLNVNENWDRWNGATGTGGGFCLHSDWVVGFFVNFYNIVSPDIASCNPAFPNNLLQGYLGSTQYVGRQTTAVKARYGQCAHDSNDKCTESAHICHYVTPDRMQLQHQQQ